MLTKQERHVMEHAVAWHKDGPRYRNHFVAGEGHSDWLALQALCERGLMHISRQPSELSGGDFVFCVTEAGLEELRKPGAK